jgi:hypothetical protein
MKTQRDKIIEALKDLSIINEDALIDRILAIQEEEAKERRDLAYAAWFDIDDHKTAAECIDIATGLTD